MNIGACARAMSNFGLSDLWIVAPYEPVWREAQSAVGAEELLKNAKAVETIEEALIGCSFVLGTSCLKRRKPEIPVLSLPDWKPKGKTAVLFGPEKTGLTEEHLSRCSAILRIPTLPECPSMNLAQSVAVFCYELARKEKGRAFVKYPLPEKMGSEVRERILKKARMILLKTGSADLKERERLRRLRRALARWDLSVQEGGTVEHLFNRILKSLISHFP